MEVTIRNIQFKELIASERRSLARCGTRGERLG